LSFQLARQDENLKYMYPSIVYEFNVKIQQCTYCGMIVIKKQNKISIFF